VRARLTALSVLVLVAATAIVLGTSYGLMADHLRATLPEVAADDILGRLASQYALALLGTAILALAVGWAAAGRMLRPLKTITATARHVSDERLGERIALAGPRDELRELADTFDAMLERLQESMEAQRRFVANASHELRSPLTVIRTEADVALADPDADVAELRRMGEAVLEATDRTEALLDGLMVLARSQRGLVRRRPADLAVAARRAADEASSAARAAGLDLTVDAGEAPVTGDDHLLARLVGNLVDNAVRYNGPGGRIAVDTGRTNGTAHVRVANTGPRVPAGAVDRLTEPFERLGRSADGRGAGLGLSIVRAVADAHGGDVRIAAPAQGGLDVTVELPARPA